jgi:hypothetical protein
MPHLHSVLNAVQYCTDYADDRAVLDRSYAEFKPISHEHDGEEMPTYDDGYLSIGRGCH